MSNITKPILLDETGKAIVSQLRHQNALLEVMASDKIHEMTSDLSEIAQLVKDGLAKEVLDYGDKLNIPWHDNENGVSKQDYNEPWNVCHFEDAELRDGELVPVMDAEWHYTTPFGVPFSETQALFESESALPAGTYHFTVQNDSWGGNNGKTFQFTTDRELPVGGQLRKTAAYNAAMAGTTLRAFNSAYHRTHAWEVTLTEGTAGTDLGITNGVGDLNHFHRLNLGHNRWSTSCLRSYLNSMAKRNTEGNADGWYVKTEKWDVMPSVALTKDGFLSGYPEDVVACMLETKIQTATNTVIDGGVTDVTYDRVFLKSLEQWYVVPQVSGVEGEYWEYWKLASGKTAPSTQYSTEPLRKVYAVNSHTSAQSSWQRSCYRGDAYLVWHCSASGYVNYNAALNSYRCQPACRIGKI